VRKLDAPLSASALVEDAIEPEHCPRISPTGSLS
jgi:hypothetical protein